MEIPIYIDSERTGSVSITKDGTDTLVRARLRDPGRVVRLTLYGEGEAYLGVPVPSDGGLALSKRFRPGTLPPAPEYAAEHPREKKKEPPRCVLWHGGKPYYF